LGFKVNSAPAGPAEVDGCVGVDERWLEHLKVGTQIDFADARGAKRHLLVVQRDALGAIGESVQTAYLTPETLLTINGAEGKKWRSTLAGQIEALPGVLHLRKGDLLRVTRQGLGQIAMALEEAEDEVQEPAHISCTWPQVIDQVQVGERIWFDDGRLGGVIHRKVAEGLEVEITQARDGGEKLTGNKNIILPDSELDLPALTEQDLQDLASVVDIADMVGLSFVQQPHDVHRLREHLKKMGRPDLGVVLKIETLKGFENLPELMLAAMIGEVVGVMVARGELAVECGYDRLAEVQEEILWCTEAAHLPVIWATQVLDSLAKTGVPSRAEISDASMGVRAQCVLLGQGLYVLDAIRTLDDVLKRLGGHPGQKPVFAP
jgi:pyruvate kinase